MIYITAPYLHREVFRAFELKPPKDGEQHDFSISRTGVEVPFGWAALADDARKKLTKAKAGDELLLATKLSGTMKSRIIHLEVPDQLYRYGRPTFKRVYKPGDRVFGEVYWQCTKDYNLEELPFLYEAFILDGVIR